MNMITVQRLAMKRIVFLCCIVMGGMLSATAAFAAMPTCLWVSDASGTARLLDSASGEELTSIAGFTATHAAMLDDSCDLWAVADDGVTLNRYTAGGDLLSSEYLSTHKLNKKTLDPNVTLTRKQVVRQLQLTPHPASGFRTTLHDTVKLMRREANTEFASFADATSPLAVATAADVDAAGAGYWELTAGTLSFYSETGAAGAAYALNGRIASPSALVVDPIRNHAWIGGADGILIVNLAAGQVVRKIALARAVEAMAWDNRHGIAWARTLQIPRKGSVKTYTYAVTAYALDGSSPGNIAVTTDDSADAPGFAVLPATSQLAVGTPEGLLLYSPQGVLQASYLGGTKLAVLAAPPLVPKPQASITQPAGISQGTHFEVQVETLCAGEPCHLPTDRLAAREAAYGIASSEVVADTACTVPLTRDASSFTGSWPAGCAIGDGEVAVQVSFNARPLTGAEPDPALYRSQIAQTFVRDTTPPVISGISPVDGTTIKGENPVVPLSGNTDDPGSMTILENAGEWQAAEANPQNGTAFLWNITLKPGLNTATLSSLDQVGNGSAAQTAVTYIPTGTATWNFYVPNAGRYDVVARWIGQGSPATAVYRIQHADGAAVVSASPVATGNLALGSYRFLPGVRYAVSMDSAEGTGVAMADAVSLTPQEAGFNIFPDQLGTPRVITDANGQEVWRWEMDDPFGTNPAVGSIEMPLRFPGQAFDSETGLHYNYFRDYDPGSGRYIESDPIGLAGGINTYGYTLQNPLSFIDTTGLDVTISFNGSAAAGAGHVGIGVNSPNTVGQRPQAGQNPVAIAVGQNVPGEISPDPAPDARIVIPTTPRQDQQAQQCIDTRKREQQNYNLYQNNCAQFVGQCLNAAGVPVPDTLYPRTLFNDIQRRYSGGR